MPLETGPEIGDFVWHRREVPRCGRIDFMHRGRVFITSPASTDCRFPPHLPAADVVEVGVEELVFCCRGLDRGRQVGPTDWSVIGCW